MDPSKDSDIARSIVKVDADGEGNKNFKNVPTHAGVRGNADLVFTTSSNQTLSFISINRPREYMNHSSSNEQSGYKSGDNNSDTNKNLNNCTQSQQMCKISNTNADQADRVAPGVSGSLTNSYDNGTDSNEDAHISPKQKSVIDKTGSINLPSTSGASNTRICDNPEGGMLRESRKRPSSLKLNTSCDSSSDTGNDDYSLGSEDGCIYTYRGGEHLADLPSSFFSLDMGLPLDNHLPILNYPAPPGGAVPRDQHSRASSPDMDFLEMDFDPGPSCEVDTGDESSDVELEVVSDMPEENEPLTREASPEQLVVTRHNTVSVPVTTSSGLHVGSDVYLYSVASTSRGVTRAQASENDAGFSYGPYIPYVNLRGEQLLVRRTMALGLFNIPVNLHVSSGDLVSPKDILDCEEEHAEKPFAHQINQGEHSADSTNLSSALYHSTMVKKLLTEKSSDSETQSGITAGEASSAPIVVASTSMSGPAYAEPPRSMIWSESEACERQVTQIGTSACGATAVVNVFNALGVPVNLEKINTAVGTRQRANNAPLPRYLLSRAVAGCTAADLVTGIHTASDGLVTARFFPTYPERVVSLSHWLADWITLGAVPTLTLNLQVGCEGEIPDAWHHQMVFGVSPRGVYLCNPVECLRESSLWPRLTSPSVLLVRTRDVLSRFTTSTDLTPLMAVPDRRFHTFNVLGQVANVIREWRALGWGEYGTRTRHIRIPASYQAGVTVAALTGSEAHRRLMWAPQLPILGKVTF